MLLLLSGPIPFVHKNSIFVFVNKKDLVVTHTHTDKKVKKIMLRLTSCAQLDPCDRIGFTTETK